MFFRAVPALLHYGKDSLMGAALARNLDRLRSSIRSALFARTARMRHRRAIVSFTFDDFPKSAVSNGARLLENHQLRGTFYLTGSYCGRVVDEVPQYGPEDLAALVAVGHEIGCHTFTHPRVSALSRSSLDKEIGLNADFVAHQSPGIKLRTFAYPYGDISFDATCRLQARFMGCRSSQPGLNAGTIDLGRLRSQRLYEHLIDAQSVSKLIREAVNKTAWLIFYTHDVAETPSRFGCTPVLLEHAIRAAISAGAEIRPIDGAIETICGAR